MHCVKKEVRCGTRRRDNKRGRVAAAAAAAAASLPCFSVPPWSCRAVALVLVLVDCSGALDSASVIAGCIPVSSFQFLPSSAFSGAQLKLKAKRKCKPCILQQQQQTNEVEAVSSASYSSDASPAASSAAASASASSAKPCFAPSPLADHSANVAQPLPSSCCVCNNRRGKLRTCSQCASVYCGLACLKTHKNSGMCDATRTIPPLDGIAEEDRLSMEELAELWPPLHQLCAQRNQVIHRNMQRSLPAELCTYGRGTDASVADLAPLVELYPPRLNSDVVWWTAGCHQAHINASAVRRAVELFAGVLRGTLLFSPEGDPSLPYGWARHRPAPPSPVFSDGRIIHRLVTYAIYFFRHVDPLLLPAELRSHVHVQSDEHGELPLLLDTQASPLSSLRYLSSVDDAGCRLLLPFVGSLLLSPPSPPGCLYRRFNGLGHCKVLITSGPNNAPVREAGLLVENLLVPKSMNPLGTQVMAFSGWTADRFSCAIADLSCVQAGNEEDLRPRCALIEVMRAALAEQWPKVDEAMFIAIPRRGLETELTELLLLEALKEEADVGDAQARQLLAHLVEESGATDVSELIDAQRSRVEEMQQWQQEQLRLHAEAVERTEQRASQRKALKVAPTIAPAASAPECKHAPSSFASAPASVSVVTASNGSAPAPSSELSTAQAASTAELACSWTADSALTNVASLLQTGRRKFGVIVKTALKFLHSLQPTSVNQSGSHRVFHFGQSGPVTLILPHAGRRSKDGTVSQRYCTRLYKAMQHATMSQFGPMHAAAQVKQGQPQMLLKAAASSSTAALAEFD